MEPGEKTTPDQSGKMPMDEASAKVLQERWVEIERLRDELIFAEHDFKSVQMHAVRSQGLSPREWGVAFEKKGANWFYVKFIPAKADEA